MALKTSLRASLKALQTGSNALGSPTFNPDIEAFFDLADGFAADQADRCYFAERTVLTAANDDLDLAGVMTDIFGATLTFAKLKALLVYNKPTNSTNLTIGGGTNPFIGFLSGTTPTIGPIRPGGFLMLACPALTGIGAVVASTGDILRISNSAGASNTYQIGIIGTSA